MKLLKLEDLEVGVWYCPVNEQSEEDKKHGVHDFGLHAEYQGDGEWMTDYGSDGEFWECNSNMNSETGFYVKF